MSAEDEFSPLEQTVQDYEQWLLLHSPDHRLPFLQRLKVEPESAQGEAVTFSVLQSSGLSPRPAEIIGKGGVDFICEPRGGDAFFVEVATLLTPTVAAASGIPAVFPDGETRGFAQITTKLLSIAKSKVEQLAGSPGARVLVLATQHPMGLLVMNPRAAEELLTGTTSFRIPLGPNAGQPPTLVTELENSVFCKPSQDRTTIEAVRQSISAIILMTISAHEARLIGLLHPCPKVPFDHRVIDAHFVRFKSWPIEPSSIQFEWVGMKPSARTHSLLPFGLSVEIIRSLENAENSPE